MDGIKIMYSLICFVPFFLGIIMWRHVSDAIARSIYTRQTHSRSKFIANLYFNCKFYPNSNSISSKGKKVKQEKQSPSIFLIIYSTNEDKFCIATIINEI